MTKLLLLGAGKIGGAITAMLADTGDYEVSVADSDEAMLELIPDSEAARRNADLSHAESVLALAKDKDVIVSALPYYLNVSVAETARKVGAHYFDLTEDVETTIAVKTIATRIPKPRAPKGLARKN